MSIVRKTIWAAEWVGPGLNPRKLFNQDQGLSASSIGSTRSRTSSGGVCGKYKILLRKLFPSLMTSVRRKWLSWAGGMRSWRKLWRSMQSPIFYSLVVTVATPCRMCLNASNSLKSSHKTEVTTWSSMTLTRSFYSVYFFVMKLWVTKLNAFFTSCATRRSWFLTKVTWLRQSLLC